LNKYLMTYYRPSISLQKQLRPVLSCILTEKRTFESAFNFLNLVIQIHILVVLLREGVFDQHCLYEFSISSSLLLKHSLMISAKDVYPRSCSLLSLSKRSRNDTGILTLTYSTMLQVWTPYALWFMDNQ